MNYLLEILKAVTCSFDFHQDHTCMLLPEGKGRFNLTGNRNKIVPKFLGQPDSERHLLKKVVVLKRNPVSFWDNWMK